MTNIMTDNIIKIKKEKEILKTIKTINKYRSILLQLENKYSEKQTATLVKKIKGLQSDIDDEVHAMNTLNKDYEHFIKEYYNNLLKNKSLIELNKIIKKFPDEHNQLLQELNKQKHILSELHSSYNVITSKFHITPKTQKKKIEQIRNDLKNIAEEVQVQGDNFNFLCYQHDLYKKYFSDFENKVNSKRIPKNEEKKKQKEENKKLANKKRSELMKKRTYKLKCNLYVIVSDKIEDLDKLKTATGKKANKDKYRIYEGKTYKKVFKDFHVTVKTNMAKN